MAVIDLDGFKVVNDQFGHDAGDEVLRQVAEAMRLHLRPYDVISRVGGDEFVLLLMRTAADQSELVVERLIQALPIPASIGTQTIFTFFAACAYSACPFISLYSLTFAYLCLSAGVISA